MSEEQINRRAWSSARQWRAAAFTATVVVLVVLAVWLGKTILSPHGPGIAAAASPPGTFRPSAQQFKTFTIEAVTLHAFVSEELTEGKIGVNGDHSTQVVSPYSGRVTRVIAGLGDTVKAGAPLATLEATEFAQAQNDLKVAVSQVKLAGISETRKHALYDAKGGSLQDWQQAQADLASAEANLNAVRNRLQIFGNSPEQIVKLENAQTLNPGATITAPLAGVVVDRQIGPGQFLQSGGPPVFTIADPSTVWLLANVRESDAGLVKVGQLVEVRVPAYPKRIFKARVTRVAEVVDPVTHRLPVRAEIDNHDGALKLEMFANFRILTSDTSESPAVPQAAVVYEGDSAHVWVVAGDDLLTYRKILPGRSTDGFVEVLDGLKAGERVVTKGGLFIDQAAVPASS
jgi:membrane fusion protein, heavy metal efflux system